MYRSLIVKARFVLQTTSPVGSSQVPPTIWWHRSEVEEGWGPSHTYLTLSIATSYAYSSSYTIQSSNIRRYSTYLRPKLQVSMIMEAQGMTSVLIFWWGRTRYMAEVKRLVRDTLSSSETLTESVLTTSFPSSSCWL